MRTHRVAEGEHGAKGKHLAHGGCEAPTSLLLSSEAFFDELSDGFGARGEAVGPSVVVDLLQEPWRDRDNDARVRLLGLGWHGAIVPWVQHAVNMRGMRAS